MQTDIAFFIGHKENGSKTLIYSDKGIQDFHCEHNISLVKIDDTRQIFLIFLSKIPFWPVGGDKEKVRGALKLPRKLSSEDH